MNIHSGKRNWYGLFSGLFNCNSDKMMADADDMTECPVCLKIYDESEVRMPRLLPCSHTICHGCLGTVIKGNSLVCTECKTKHQAAYGPKTFFQNRYILRLLKIKKEMDDILKAKDQKPAPVSNLPNFSECERHNRLLSLYCKDEQGGHGTGNLVLTFSRQGKHREFCSDTEKFANTGKIFGL